jgi:hypothetical protein
MTDKQEHWDADRLHMEIMNIRVRMDVAISVTPALAYKEGHRDARHAAAELVAAHAAPQAQPTPIPDNQPLADTRLTDEPNAKMICTIIAAHHRARAENLLSGTSNWATYIARAIEAAIVPQWLPIETAPKDGSDVWLHVNGKVLRCFWVDKEFKEFRDADGCYIGQQDPDAFWMSAKDGDEVDATEWQPIPIPPTPKAEG